jgi:hypothetical protein
MFFNLIFNDGALFVLAAVVGLPRIVGLLVAGGGVVAGLLLVIIWGRCYVFVTPKKLSIKLAIFTQRYFKPKVDPQH